MGKILNVLALCMLVLASSGCQEQVQTKKQKPPVTVTTAVAKMGSVLLDAMVPAGVEPERTATLLAQVEGEVLALPYREGDQLRKGDLLVKIDPSRLEAALREAEAQGDLVEAEIKEARSVLSRDQALFQRQGLGQEALEHSRTRVAILNAQLRQAEGQMAAIQAQLDDTQVRAPFDGYVLERWVELGDVVGARSALLSVASKELLISARVSELDLPSLRVGSKVSLSVDAVERTAGSARMVGIVSRIHPKIDPDTRTATVEIRPDEQFAGRLNPGMFVRVTLVKAKRDSVLVIPGAAVVVKADGSAGVFVVDGGLARKRSVTIGLEGPDVIEILSGLQEGDEVIVRGQERLKDGTAIRIPGSKKGETKTRASAQAGGGS